MAAPAGCGTALLRVDGDAITTRDVEALRTAEGSTGLWMSRPTALLATIEHRTTVAVARRAAFSASADDLLRELERMQAESHDETALADAIRRAGEPAYLRWIVEPALAEKWLLGVWQTSVVADGERRVASALKMAQSEPSGMKIAAARSGGAYLRFRLEPDSPTAHLPTGVRLGYEADLRAYNRGLREERPAVPVNDFDHIEGHGLVPRGYVQELARKVLAPLADGAVWPKPVHDGRDWYVVRRLRASAGTFDVEAVRFKRPEYADWFHARRRDLAYQVCRPGVLAEAATEVPDHPLWEFLR